MKTEGFRRTLQGVIDGRSFRVEITSQVEDEFEFTATVEGVAVAAPRAGVIRNKGDAMQLAMAAIEKHIADQAREA
ncbi:hypothetical protein [Stenotrophomonas sp.]|uniref:hypothetical protein n=1 Tax=Stenotrophomonas sp. TaxID=69392 RepID=UPI0028AEC5B9|nr:hypothetical protein [Stenotrophomonas sp.]